MTEPISGIVLLFIAAFAPYMVYRFISFLGFDLYHAMGSEQEAKSAVNRPVPVPSKPQSDGVKKVLDGGSGGDATPNATPTATGAPSTSASTAGAGAGSGAAAGPAAAVVIGAEVVKGAATAGPQLGGAVGGTAESAAAGAGGSGEATAAPHSTPQPPTPRTDPAPPSTQLPQPRPTGKE